MMGFFLKRFWGRTEGTSAVEFGIIAFPLFLVVFGIFEFGRAMWVREALQQTAIAGARCMGLVQSSCGTSGTYSASMTTSFIQSQAAAWSVPLASTDIVSNNKVCDTLPSMSQTFSQVKLTYTFKPIVPIMIPSLSSGLQLSAVACFPNEG